MLNPTDLPTLPDMVTPYPMVVGYLRSMLTQATRELLDQPRPPFDPVRDLLDPPPDWRYLQHAFHDLPGAQAVTERLARTLNELIRRGLVEDFVTEPAVYSLGGNRFLLTAFVRLSEGKDHLTNEQLNELCGYKGEGRPQPAQA